MAIIPLDLVRPGDSVRVLQTPAVEARVAPATVDWLNESADYRLPTGPSTTFIARLVPGPKRTDRLFESLASIGSVSHVKILPRLGYAIVEAEASAHADLLMSANVLDVWPDRVHSLPDAHHSAEWPIPAVGAGWNLERSGATAAWDLGVIGEGAVIATLDSGAMWSHPALRDSYRGRDGVHDHDWIDVTGDEPARAPVDPNGHGTHVLGTIVGRSGDETWGVAPGAEWISARVFDGAGRSTDSSLLLAAEWLLAPTAIDGSDPRPDLAPDVINGSWTLESGADPLYSDILKAWRDAGIVAVFAAGNDTDGSGAWATIRMPGAHMHALAVGALDARGIAWWLSRGGPAFDGELKPDLMAPGVDIVSADARGGSIARTGTSMSAPHVSGAAALLRSARPEFSPDAVAAFLRAHALDSGERGPDVLYGWGALDAGAAVGAALGAGRVSGMVRRIDEKPLVQALIEARRVDSVRDGDPTPWRTFVGADGRFQLDLPSDRWEVEVSSPGVEVQRRVVTIESREATTSDFVMESVATGRVVGAVRSGWWGPLKGARVEWPDPNGSGSVSAVTDGAGDFVLELPAGRKVVHVSAEKHRAITLGLEVLSGEDGAFEVELEASPSVLIVDADAYQAERIWPYIDRALDDGGFDADVRTIDSAEDTISTAELLRYDVVIWLHGNGSPGSIDRARGDRTLTSALTNYAHLGGRLVVAGRSIGAWDAEDGPASNRFAPELFRDVLGARLMRIYSAPDDVLGVGPLAGLAIDLRSTIGRISAERATGEWIAPAPGRPEGEIIPLLRSGDELYGVAVDDANGRRALITVGLERAGGRSALRELFDRLLGWLDVPGIGFDEDLGTLALDSPVMATLSLHAGRSALTADVQVDFPPGVRPGATLGGFWKDEGVLTWRGALGAGTSLHFNPVLELDPDSGIPGSRRLITATVVTGKKVLTATSAITIAAPDLYASRLEVTPARSRAAGVVELNALLLNAGTASTVAGMEFDDLPVDFLPDRPSLRASGGTTLWEAGTAKWTGIIEPKESVSVTLSGRLGEAALPPSRFGVALTGSFGTRLLINAEARIGGPEIVIAEPEHGGPIELTAGRPFTLPISLLNVGDTAADARFEIGALRGVTIEPTTVDSLEIAAGVSRTFDIRLIASGEAESESLSISVDDGLRPEAIVKRDLEISILKPDPALSRFVFVPGAARSRSTVTGTLLVANHGTAAGRFATNASLPPTMVIEPGSVRSTGGSFEVSAGAIAWDLDVEPARSRYEALGAEPWSRPTAAGTLPERSELTGLRGPMTFDFAFPMQTSVFTQAWVSDQGLILFEPQLLSPDAGRGLDGLDGAAIAVGWNGEKSVGAPMVERAAERMTVSWSGEDPEAWSAASFDAEGHIAMAWSPATAVRDAHFGVRQGDGLVVRPDPADIYRRSLVFRSPGGWEALSFRTRLASSLALDTTLSPIASLRWAGVERVMTGRVRANPIRRDWSEISILPSAPAAGGRARFLVSVGADGDFEPREFKVRLVAPAAATIVSGPGKDGMWSETLGPGVRRDLIWEVNIREGLAPGAPIVVRAVIGARGQPARTFEVVANIGPPTRQSAELRVAPSMPWPGESVLIEVTIASRMDSLSSSDVELQVPMGLKVDTSSLRSSRGPAPTWDPADRKIRWSGELGIDASHLITASARFEGAAAERITLVLTATDSRGSTAGAWADVFGAAARVRLPWVASSRPSPLSFGQSRNFAIGVTDNLRGPSIEQRP